MTDFIGRLGSIVDSICMVMIDAGATIQKGLLKVGEEGSRAMYEVYSLQGFEKWSKAAITNMRALSLIPSCRGVFDQCIKTMEAQKDLIYATLVFESATDFITVDVDGETGEKRYNFQIPRERNGNIDIVKILYGIVNPLDTLHFLQKYQLVSFPLASKVAARVGSIPVFFLEKTVLNDIPVVNSLFNKPKEFFVFVASGYTVYKCLQEPHFTDVNNLLKLASNIGKIILISSADYLIKKNLVAFTVIDVVTQNAGLISLLLKRSQEREKRFNNPTGL